MSERRTFERRSERRSFFRERNKSAAHFFWKERKVSHYLMRFEPNWKKILQNSGKWISIPEGM